MVGHGRFCRMQKVTGLRNHSEPSVHCFPPEADREYRRRHTAPLPPSRHASSSMVSCCPPVGRLNVNGRVDVERASYPSVDAPLSAASSNNLVLTLIRPHPYRQNPFHSYPAPPYRGQYLRVFNREITHRTARAGDLGR
jgi:hypothetical protein